MTIFEFALLRAARQKMTPAELKVADHIVSMVEAGQPGSREMLRKMVHDVLHIRHTPMTAAQQAVE